MKMHFDCVPCMINGLLNLYKQGLIEEEYQEVALKEVMKYYQDLDFSESPLLVNRNLHKKIREIAKNKDPYKFLKDKYNHIALDLYDKYKQVILDDKNPFDKAMRLALSGNIIDFGPGHAINVEKAIERIFNVDLGIDDSKKLYEEIKKAKSILYLADNTGEIVFDKLFLEVINHDNVTLAVRHSPILNDATIEDVEYLGIDKIVKEVITNGDNSPGTLLTHVSQEFLEKFNSVDLIISKGQGNYEGLHEVTDKNLFMLFMAKCDIIAEDAGVKKGDCVVKHALV